MSFSPEEWLCAALSTGGAAANFKVVKIGPRDGDGTTVTVLHKESGAVWAFKCGVVR